MSVRFKETMSIILTIDSNPMKSKITLFKRKLYISLQNNNNKKLNAI